MRALDNRVTADLTKDDAQGRVALLIPYYDLDGSEVEFTRLRLLGEPVGFKRSKYRKKPLRFWQEPGSTPVAYFSPLLGRSWRTVAKDPSVDLVLTEGEVKAAAGCHAGFATVGLSGVDNFHLGGDKDHLVPGLDGTDFKGRNVAVVYDSDAATNKYVQRAERELQAALERRGAFVQIVRFPPAENGGSRGWMTSSWRRGRTSSGSCSPARIGYRTAVALPPHPQVRTARSLRGVRRRASGCHGISPLARAGRRSLAARRSDHFHA